jgi:AAHS family 4-hydroxybenzoate transporter-like MFS transporter
LRRIVPDIDTDCQFTIDQKNERGTGVTQLFSVGRALVTFLLWATFFITFMLLVTCASWTPALLQRTGVDPALSSLAVALFSAGSVVGTPLAGFLINHFGVRRFLPAALASSAFALAAAGLSGNLLSLLLVSLGLTGFFLGGASSGLIAIAPLLYPTTIRSTGVGWAMALGRFGSFVGPLVISLLVNNGWQTGSSFIVLGVPAFVAAFLTSLI